MKAMPPIVFDGIMKRVHRQGIDLKDAGLAHDLRDYYINRKAEFDGKTLSTPDALHLATAILYRADEFIPSMETTGIPRLTSCSCLET